MADKSEGLLRYERGLSDLQARIGRGEIKSKEEIGLEHTRILAEATPAMSEEELIRIQRLALLWHAAIAKSLAADGHNVPGNNPENPN